MNGGSTLTRSMALGALGVLIFAMTLPMTRLAVGPADAPQLPPAFVTAGRAAGAGLLAACYLWWCRAPRPGRRELPALALSALGTVLGFPMALALALREVPSMHAAVVTGLLPLSTAAMAALALRQRAGPGFWACAVAGCALVLAFAAHEGGGALGVADAWLLLAVLSASSGYVAATRLTSRHWRAEHVISWVLVLSLPLTLPVTLWLMPSVPWATVRPAAWGAFAYVTVFSMWLGFFAWYGALAMGGALQVSQVQLIQPFLSLLLAVPVLGETLKPSTLAFSVAVIAVVFWGKRMPVRPATGEGG